MSNALEPTAGYPSHLPPVHAQSALTNSGSVVLEQDDDEGGLNLLAVAWRSRWSILFCMILGGFGAWGYLQRVTPLYTSTARVYVERHVPRLLSQDSGGGGFSSQYLYTQAELIRSAPVLTSAIESPDCVSLETFRQVDSPVGLLLDKLTVEVGDRDELLYISIELPDAVEAGQIVNAVVDAYITHYSADRSDTVKDVLEILRKEKLRADSELQERRAARDKYRADHAALAVQTGNNSNVVTQLFTALSDQLNTAQISLIEAKTRYQRIKRMLESPDQLPYLQAMAYAAGNERRSGDLESQIQQVEQQLLAERSRWGDGYPTVKLLKESLANLTKKRDEHRTSVVKGYVDNMRQEYELLVQRRDELQRAYDKQFRLATDVSSQAAKLASLEDAYQHAKDYSDQISGEMRQLNLDKEAGGINIRPVDSAGPGMESFPKRTKILSIGLAIGSLLGFGIAWLRELLDQRLKSVDEIASVMQLPVIGALPIITGIRGQGEAGRSNGGRIVALQPHCSASEAVRTLRTALHFGLAGPEAKIYVVTSPAPGDGKSTVASNLAISMANAGQRVLMIDADMRKPTQHEIFEINCEQGIAAMLSGTIAPAEAIVPTGVPSLDLMPCGKRPTNPVELLTNGVLSEALSQLGHHYDRIVIDSPPVMPVADARMIASLGDCTMLVLRAERSTRRISVAARDELVKIRAARLGIVVNAVPMHSSGYGGYGYSAYGGYGHIGREEEEQRSSGKRKRPRLKSQRREDSDLTTTDAQ